MTRIITPMLESTQADLLAVGEKHLSTLSFLKLYKPGINRLEFRWVLVLSFFFCFVSFASSQTVFDWDGVSIMDPTQTKNSITATASAVEDFVFVLPPGSSLGTYVYNLKGTASSFTITFSEAVDVSSLTLVTTGSGEKNIVITPNIGDATTGVIPGSGFNPVNVDFRGITSFTLSGASDNRYAVDDIVLPDATPPVMSAATRDSDTQITVDFSENVQTNGTNPTDFTVTDCRGNTYAVSNQADGTAGDSQIVLTVADLSDVLGDLTLTYANNNDEVSDLAGNVLATNSTGITVPSIQYFDVSFATFSGAAEANELTDVVPVSGARDIKFNNDGTKMFIVDRYGYYVYEYHLSVAFDVSTATNQGQTEGNYHYNESPGIETMTFNSDGSKMYLFSPGGKIFEYDLATNFDVSTASYNGSAESLQPSLPSTNTTDFQFSNDGLKLFIRADDKIHEYATTTAFDVNTFTYSGASEALTVSTNGNSFDFNNDGTRLYVSDSDTDQIVQYNLTNAFDVSTGTQAGVSYLIDPTVTSAAVEGIEFNSDGSKMYLVDGTKSDVFEFTLGDLVAPKLSSATKDSDTEITVTLSETVTIVGANPTDFAVTDGFGTSYTVSAIADGTARDDKVVLTVASLASAIGDLTVTYTNNSNEIADLLCNYLATDSKGVTIDLDMTAPTLASAKRDSDTQITIILSEKIQYVPDLDCKGVDFTVKDADNVNYPVDDQADGTAKDDKIVLTVADFSTAKGPLTVTYEQGPDQFLDFGSNRLATNATGLSVSLDLTPPTFNNAGSTPMNDDTNVAADGIIVLDFDEDIKQSTGNVTIRDVTGGEDFEVMSVSNNLTGSTSTPPAGTMAILGDKLYIHPSKRLTFNNEFAILIEATVITDLNDNAFAGISDENTFSFTTEQNTLPVFTTSPTLSIDEGDDYFYPIGTSDANGDVVTVTATTLPEWLSLSSSQVSTFAGSGTDGNVDAIGTAASFGTPTGIDMDANGNIFISDQDNSSIRKITPAGVVTTFAGSGSFGSADGTALEASFATPSDLAIDSQNNIYVVEQIGRRVRKITSTGIVSTLAGSGDVASVDGTGTLASFRQPASVGVDASGNVYVGDASGNNVRKITPDGVVTTLAGSGETASTDGTGTAASFNRPVGLTVDDSGNVYVVESGHLVRKITPAGVVTTLAGSGIAGTKDGTGTDANFNFPSDIDIDEAGNLYVVHRSVVRKITPDGVVTTFAGTGDFGSTDGPAANATFGFPTGITIDTSGNFFVIDRNDYNVRKITQPINLTGNSTGQVGMHDVVLTADDGFGGITQKPFTITINDITPPVFENSTPNASGISGTGFSLNTDLDEAGTIYYIVIPNDSKAPTSAEVKAGTRTEDFTIEAKGSAAVTSDGFVHAFSVTGLTSETAYDVYAVAEDVAGNLQTSPSLVEVTTLDITAPTAPLISSFTTDTGASATDNLTNDQTLIFAGTAEAGSTLEVFIGGTSIGTTITDDAGEWSYDHTGTSLTDGNYSITATATDAAGNESDASTALNIEVDITAPTVPTIDLIAASDSGNSDSDDISMDRSPTLEGTAEANVTLLIFVDDSQVGTTTADDAGNWTFTISNEWAGGTYAISAKAEDAAGNVSSESTDLNYTLDTTAPTAPVVSNISTDSGVDDTDGITNDSTPDVSGTAEANSTVEVFIDESSVGTATADASGDWTLAYNGESPADDGDILITAKATDIAGNTSVESEALPVTIDTTAPDAPSVVSISTDSGSTSDDGITNDNTLTITGTAESNTTVNVSIDGTGIGSTTADGSGNFSFDHTGIPLADGSYSLTATATDAAGNTSAESTILNLTVDTTAPTTPTVDLVAASDLGISVTDNLTSDITPTVEGTTEANATVLVFVDDSQVGTTTADDAGNWTFTIVTDWGDGTYAITTKAQDAAGNESVASESLSITLDNALSISSTSPADNEVDVLPNANLTLTFDENVVKGTGNIQIIQSSNDQVQQSIDVTGSNVTVSGATVTINPPANILPPDTEFYVNIDAGAFENEAGADYAGLTSKTEWSFTIIAASVVTSVGVPAEGTYNIGDNLDFTVNMVLPVSITGTATIPVTIGSTTVNATQVGAVSNASAILFRYAVVEDELDADGIAVGAAIDLNGGTMQDEFGVDAILTLNGVASTAAVLVDGVKPTPTITSTAVNLVNGTFSATITYDEAVENVEATDLTVVNGTASNLMNTVAGTTWTVDISPTADGTTSVSLAANTAKDLAGNDSKASNTISRNFDGTAPTVLSVNRKDSDPLNTATTEAGFRITFSEAVTGVDIGDVEVVLTGSATGLLNGLTAIDATTYDVSVSGIGGEGTIGLNVKDDDSIIDAATNPLAAAFTGQVYTTNFVPTDIALSTTNTDENNGLTATLATIATTDADPTDSHTYTLVAGTGDTDNGSFAIEGSNLNANGLSFNFEDKASYELRLMTDDGKGGKSEKAFTLTINDLNEVPMMLSLSNSVIDESDQAQDIGTLVALDQDGGETFSYSLVAGTGDTDNAQFEINGTTLRTAGATNFEDGATRSILVRVTDSGGLTLDQQFTITINNVVEETVRPYTQDAPGADVKNVFSPNGDGVNETWIIEDLLDNPVNEVKVYAQGGKLIFSQTNYQNDWGGTFNGNAIPDGTYYYEITVFASSQDSTPARVIRGFLTIIRSR